MTIEENKITLEQGPEGKDRFILVVFDDNGSIRSIKKSWTNSILVLGAAEALKIIGHAEFNEAIKQ